MEQKSTKTNARHLPELRSRIDKLGDTFTQLFAFPATAEDSRIAPRIVVIVLKARAELQRTRYATLCRMLDADVVCVHKASSDAGAWNVIAAVAPAVVVTTSRSLDRTVARAAGVDRPADSTGAYFLPLDVTRGAWALLMGADSSTSEEAEMTLATDAFCEYDKARRAFTAVDARVAAHTQQLLRALQDDMNALELTPSRPQGKEYHVSMVMPVCVKLDRGSIRTVSGFETSPPVEMVIVADGCRAGMSMTGTETHLHERNIRELLAKTGCTTAMVTSMVPVRFRNERAVSFNGPYLAMVEKYTTLFRELLYTIHPSVVVCMDKLARGLLINSLVPAKIKSKVACLYQFEVHNASPVIADLGYSSSVIIFFVDPPSDVDIAATVAEKQWHFANDVIIDKLRLLRQQNRVSGKGKQETLTAFFNPTATARKRKKGAE